MSNKIDASNTITENWIMALGNDGVVDDNELKQIVAAAKGWGGVTVAEQGEAARIYEMAVVRKMPSMHQAGRLCDQLSATRDSIGTFLLGDVADLGRLPVDAVRHFFHQLFMF